MTTPNPFSCRLMLVTQPTDDPQAYLLFIQSLIAAGVDCVQFRQKQLTPAALTFAQSLRDLLRRCNVPLIINDDVALAKQLQVDGVHLGQQDGSVRQARRQLGADKIIGLSLEAETQIDVANALPVNYVACSAVFPSGSKSDLRKIWGLDGLRALCAASIHPVIAIGGITPANVRAVMRQGASGIAAIAALHGADAASQTRILRQTLEAAPDA